MSKTDQLTKPYKICSGSEPPEKPGLYLALFQDGHYRVVEWKENLLGSHWHIRPSERIVKYMPVPNELSL